MKHGRITFLLPGATRLPVGGYKVIYEYSNRLARNGHFVTIIHPAFLTKGSGLIEVARSAARYIVRRNKYRPDSWFEIDPSVRLRWVPTLSAHYIPDGDAVIATAWQTAEWAATYPLSKGQKYYLIQGLETWHGMDRRVMATWSLPLRKLVISQWLLDIAHDLGEEADYQPNGLDFRSFFMSKQPEDREAASVMMLYHPSIDKGAADGLKALSIVQREISSLRVTLFGTTQPPSDLAAWIQYNQLPRQEVLRDLYNASAIFVAPSWTEGWGLTASEAMMCGAALVATDIGGHRSYAIPEKTALVCPPKDPAKLAANILRLIRDSPLRCKIARSGHEYIQQFTWQKSIARLESALFPQVEETCISGE